MSEQRRSIWLYIYPQQGPIEKVNLDILAIEEAALAHPNPAQRDDIRVNEVIAQVRKSYPNVDIAARRDSIKNIVARFSHASYFDGMVLNLNGSINAQEGATAVHPKEMDELKQRVKLLVQERDLAMRQNANLQAITLNQERHNSELVDQLSDLRRSVKEKEEQLRICKEERKSARLELKKVQTNEAQLQTEVKQALQQASMSQTRWEALQRQSQKEPVQRQKEVEQLQKRYQEELAQLRQSINSAKQQEQQLRSTLKKREDELKILRTRLNEMMENAPTLGAAEPSVRVEHDLFDDL